MSKYPVLRTLASISRIAGWIAIAIGVIFFVLAFFGSSDTAQSNPFGSSNPHGEEVIMRMLVRIAALAVAGFGLWMVIIGELISVFLDIEENTRESADRLRTTATMTATQSSASPTFLTDAALPKTCSSCRTRNEPGAKFCEQCGKLL